jgi:hypothetical protein
MPKGFAARLFGPVFLNIVLRICKGGDGEIAPRNRLHAARAFDRKLTAFLIVFNFGRGNSPYYTGIYPVFVGLIGVSLHRLFGGLIAHSYERRDVSRVGWLGLGPGGLSVAYVAPAQLDLGLGDCFDLIQVRVYFANPLLDVPLFFQYESRTYLVKLPALLDCGLAAFLVYGVVVLLGPFDPIELC